MPPVLAKAGIHGPSTDEPIVVYEGSGTTNKSWLMADTRGSIIGYTNSNGAVTNINTYSPEGVPDDSNVGRFGYTGQMWLEGAELYHYKARAAACPRESGGPAARTIPPSRSDRLWRRAEYVCLCGG